MPARATPNTPLHIGPAGTAAPLSPQHKKFNTQVKRIAAQRALLAAWDAAVADYRRVHASDYEPLLAAHDARKGELAQWLDSVALGRKLSKADRATVAEVIAILAGELAGGAPDEASRAMWEALYERHAPQDDPQLDALTDGMAREMAQEIFGLDLQGVDLDSPEALAQHIGAQMQDRQAQAEQAASQRAAKKPSARERKAQEEAQQASQSVREVYRKLASSLHPDRETDPAERARKTALMQRVNQAYAAGHLLDLLQLQLEAEQIDPQHIAGLSEERLEGYNRVLAGQLAELQQEVRDTTMAFCMEFNLDPFEKHKPERLVPALRQDMIDLRIDTEHLQRQLQALQDDPAEFRHWLREQREALRDGDDFPDDLLALFGR